MNIETRKDRRACARDRERDLRRSIEATRRHDADWSGVVEQATSRGIEKAVLSLSKRVVGPAAKADIVADRNPSPILC